ncbi:MAG: hypothetical protein KAS66_10490 [Candidatus Omnitrophica bacterium]|nr:hypothetical protein [Candidatus Omnitrophota bacterium]
MERITGELDISGMKRFQMPDTTVRFKCPKCGDEIDIPLIDQIYYPDDDGEHNIAFECENCNIVITRKVEIVSTIVTLNVHNSEIT